MKQFFQVRTTVLLFCTITFTVAAGQASSEARIVVDTTSISDWLNWVLANACRVLDAAGLDKALIPDTSVTIPLQQTPLPLLPLTGQLSFYNGYVAGFANQSWTINNITTDSNGDILFRPEICLVAGNFSTMGIFRVNGQGVPFNINGDYKDVCFQPLIRIYAVPLPQTTNLDDFTVTGTGFIQLYQVQGLDNFQWVERPAIEFFSQQAKNAVEAHLRGPVQNYFKQTMSGIAYPLGSVVPLPVGR